MSSRQAFIKIATCCTAGFRSSAGFRAQGSKFKVQVQGLRKLNDLTLSDGLRSKTTSRRLKNLYSWGRFVNIFFGGLHPIQPITSDPAHYSVEFVYKFRLGSIRQHFFWGLRPIQPITRWNLFTNLGTNLSRKKDKFCKKRSRWLKTTASTNNIVSADCFRFGADCFSY